MKIAYNSKAETRKLFQRILNDAKLREDLTTNAQDVWNLYVGYCAATEWDHGPTFDELDGIYVDYAKGPGYSTRCFWLRSKDGTKTSFSYRRAIDEIHDAGMVQSVRLPEK